MVLSAEDSPIIAAKSGNPLIIGMGDMEKIIASDIPALLDCTDRIIYLEDGDIAAITQDDLKISNDGTNCKKTDKYGFLGC